MPVMPHSTKSTTDERGRPTCPYCGYPLKPGRLVCPAHSDLPAREQFDDRYLVREDQNG